MRGAPASDGGERQAAFAAPRVGPLGFALRLYRIDATFRGAVDLALIGLVVLAFLYPVDLPAEWLWQSRTGAAEAPASGDAAEAIKFEQRRGMREAHDRMFRIDTSLFASSRPPVRQSLLRAVEALRGNAVDQALGHLNAASEDPNVKFVRGMALLALPAIDNVLAGMQLLEAAAAGGQRQAQSNLGTLLVAGMPPITRDRERGRALLDEAARHGDSEAAKFLATLYYSGYGGVADPARAAHYLRLADSLGDLEATFSLGTVVFRGIGVPADELAGLRLIAKAAEGGLTSAQEMLGQYHLRKVVSGIAPDPTEAVHWLRKAVAAGNPEAMHNLALLHHVIAKEPPWQDEGKATALFKQCAELWHPPCQIAYASALQSGRGTEPDLPLAYVHYSMAFRVGSGSPRDKTAFAALKGALSADELRQAEQMEAAFWARRAPRPGHTPMKPDPSAPTFKRPDSTSTR